MVGNNLKSLELSEEKAMEREDAYTIQIRQLTTRLKEVCVGCVLQCFCLRLNKLTRPFFCCVKAYFNIDQGRK